MINSINAAGLRWTGRLARFTIPLRLALLVLLFVASTTAHDGAMAHDAMHFDCAIHPGALHQQGACELPDCHPEGMTCCVAGQCLLGILVAVDSEVTTGRRPLLEAPIAMKMSDCLPPSPFRPPATI